MSKWFVKLRAQVLRGAASRAGPLPLRLREGAHLKRVRSVNDTTPGPSTASRPRFILRVLQAWSHVVFQPLVGSFLGYHNRVLTPHAKIGVHLLPAAVCLLQFASGGPS